MFPIYFGIGTGFHCGFFVRRIARFPAISAVRAEAITSSGKILTNSILGFERHLRHVDFGILRQDGTGRSGNGDEPADCDFAGLEQQQTIHPPPGRPGDEVEIPPLFGGEDATISLRSATCVAAYGRPAHH